MSREGTLLQINYKNGIPDLVNVYIDEPLALENTLDFLIESAAKIVEAGNALRAAQNLAPLLPNAPIPVSVEQPQQAAQAPQGTVREVQDRWGNTWTYGLPTRHQTPRGPALLKKGISKAGKPYKGWYDPAQGPEWTGARPDKAQLWGPEFDD